MRDRAPLRRIRARKLKYHAFLSYSHKDEEVAGWLHRELEAFRVPPALVGRLAENGPIPKKLTPIFRDEHELAAADDLGEEIQAALASTHFLIVLCSPNAAASRWTNAEIAAFKKSRPDGCIFAAIASGEPFASDIPGREHEECFPPALRQKYDRRGRPTGRRAEPLAADLRGSAEERRVGFLKLVAGMLGVGLDELVQRETTQRHRRLAWLAAASLAGMAVTSGLAITAIQARDAARDQRREAEGLVAFMLGDLKDKLEPIGKLDALDGVGAKVLTYYSKQDPSTLSDAGLLQRSRALSLTAQVANSRGDSADALRLYNQALAGTAEAVRRDPSDPQRLFDHAQNVFWFGSIAADQGQLNRAEAAFRNYRSLAQRMLAIQPDNLKWRMEMQYAEANLGILLLRKRRFDEAASHLKDALNTIEAMAALDPGNPDYQTSVALSLAWLGDAEVARGDLAAATLARQRQVNLLTALSLKSDDVVYRAKLVPAQQVLGRLLAVQGRDAEARSQLQAAAAAAEALLRYEPDNRRWADNAATVHLALAQQLFSAGNYAASSPELERGCTLAEQALRASPTAERRLGDWQCEHLRGRLALASRQADRALSHAQRAVAVARAQRSGDAVADSYLMARSLLLQGDVLHGRGQADAARQSWDAGAHLANAKLEQPWESAVRGELLLRLGRSADASAIFAGLARRGIRNRNMLRV